MRSAQTSRAGSPVTGITNSRTRKCSRVNTHVRRVTPACSRIAPRPIVSTGMRSSTTAALVTAFSPVPVRLQSRRLGIDQGYARQGFEIGDFARRNHPSNVAKRECFRLDVFVFVRMRLVALTRLMKSGGLVENHFLVAVAGCRKEAAEPHDSRWDKTDFFVALADSSLLGVLVSFQAARWQLPHRAANRVAVLAHEHHLPVR